MWNHRSLALCIIALISVAGCAGLKSGTISLDSRMPAGEWKPCKERLETGDTCLTLVYANAWYSETRIKVNRDEEYEFCVPPGQVWFDKDRRSVAPKGDPGNTLMNLFKHLKRNPESLWFALIAEVTTDAKERLFAADVSKNTTVKMATDGNLMLYPNDAIGATERPEYFYENNHGQIWVAVRRLGNPSRTAADSSGFDKCRAKRSNGG